MYVRDVRELREVLSAMPDDLPLIDNDGQRLVAAEVSQYSDETGIHDCVQLEFEED